MEDIININWEQYKKINTKCSTCGKQLILNELHLCSWPDYPWKNNTIYINTQNTGDEPCLWDSMPETFPWSWIKLWWLVCTCKKCTIVY